VLTVQYPAIGEIQFVPSASAKYIRISLKPFDGICVTVPRHSSMKQAMAFVETKTDWIIHAQARIAAHEGRQTLFTPETTFATQHWQLQLLQWKSEKFRAQRFKGALKIFYPQQIDIRSAQAQQIIHDYIIGALREEARVYLPQRTEQLAAQHRFTYCGVTVKNISSRWGSCSSVNHINLNIHLMRLPEHLSDYVILHELTHTIHKNHGARFWQSLDTITGGKAKQLVAEMKQYHTTRF
jgi:predicted metal-dependent hydrolase